MHTRFFVSHPCADCVVAKRALLGQHCSCHSVKAKYVRLGLVAGGPVEYSRWSRRKVRAHQHGDVASGYV